MKYPLIGPNQLTKSHWKHICWTLNVFSKRPRKDMELTDIRNVNFSRTKKYHKATPHYPSKICKSLLEYLISQGWSEFFFSIEIQNTSIPKTKTRHRTHQSCYRTVPSDRILKFQGKHCVRIFPAFLKFPTQISKVISNFLGSFQKVLV